MPASDPISQTAAPSVVLVSRNRSFELTKVLPALAGGSVRPAEVLLADDASDDDTVEVFNRLCDELALPHRALAHAPGGSFRINSMRNAGLGAVRTPRAVILDADHVPGPDNIASHAAMLDRGENVISAGPRLEYAHADATGPVNYMWGHEPFGTIQDDPDQPLPFWGLVPASNMGLHLCFVRRVGWFDTDYDGAYGYDDCDFTYRAHLLGAFFAGRFDAYVCHVPHETIFGNRCNPRNAELFGRKHGLEFAYPPFVEAVTHSENWAKRYARVQAERRSGPAEPSLGPSPECGAASIEATRWASANVGGRFLLKLAAGKLLRRLGGKAP